MFEYIRSPDIYRATSLFAFTVLAYKKHPLGALAALVRYSGLNISSEPGSIEHYTRRGKIGGKIREIMP